MIFSEEGAPPRRWLRRRFDTQVLSGHGCLVIRSGADKTSIALKGTGLLLWEMLAVPTTIEEMVRSLTAEYEGNPGDIARDVGAFVDALAHHELIAFPGPPSAVEMQRCRYLNLLKKSLLNLLYPEHELRIHTLCTETLPVGQAERMRFLRDIRQRRPETFQELIISRQAAGLSSRVPYLFSQTMIGMAALDNLQWCAQIVFSQGIPGDFLEAGVCRGGASIFLRSLQLAHGEKNRRTWLADSFQGLPRPKAEPDVRSGVDWSDSSMPRFTCGLDDVREAFRSYGVLDAGVRFLSGWFPEPLLDENLEKLAILRVDADMYESTRQVLETLYHKVSPGGFVIIDDYGYLSECWQAVDEFRHNRGIDQPLTFVNHSCVFWRVPYPCSADTAAVAKTTRGASASLFGLRVHSNYPLPFATGGEEPGETGAELVLCYEGRIARPANLPEKPPYRLWRQEADWWTLEFGNRRRDILTMRFAPDGSFLSLAHSFPRPEDMLWSLLGAGMSAALHLRGKHLLHAAALASGEGAILLAGDSGAGKSTLAAMLAAQGMPVLADDLAALEVSHQGIWVSPGHPLLKISRQTAELLGTDPQQLAPILSPPFETREYWLDTNMLAGGFRNEIAKLKAIYIVRRPDAMLASPLIRGPFGVDVHLLEKLAYGHDWLGPALRPWDQLAYCVPVFTVLMPEGLDRLHAATKALTAHMRELS